MFHNNLKTKKYTEVFVLCVCVCVFCLQIYCSFVYV